MTSRVNIPSQSGCIEAVIRSVGGKTMAVLCHPYGPLGGNMDNNVILGLSNYLNGLGINTTRFNFRGVGSSGGRTSFTGSGEVSDVVAVTRYLGDYSFLLVGYSYGSIACCAAVKDIPNVIGIISISYPIGVLWALTMGNSKAHIEPLSHCRVPKLFLSGSRDNFTSETQFMSFVSTLPDPKTVAVIRDADHFWNDLERDLIAQIAPWMTKNFPSLMAQSRSASRDRLNDSKVISSSRDRLTDTQMRSSSRDRLTDTHMRSSSRDGLSDSKVRESPRDGLTSSSTKLNSEPLKGSIQLPQDESLNRRIKAYSTGLSLSTDLPTDSGPSSPMSKASPQKTMSTASLNVKSRKSPSPTRVLKPSPFKSSETLPRS